jgi:hypothetical protein
VLIDCETCLAPTSACQDCLVTFLLERPGAGAGAPVEVDAAEAAALGSLADAGLVPPLRLVSSRLPGSSGLGREIA